MPSITPTQLKTRAVIFDLDGVLVWTIPMHWWAFRKTFEAEGKEFPLEEYMRFAVGSSREEVITEVLGELPPGKLEQLMAAKGHYVRRYLEEEGVRTIPGSREFVDAVRARGLRTAVASASRTPRLLLETVGTAGLFEEIVDRSMVPRSKPQPDLFLLTAEKLGVAPSECLVIEDSAVGVQAARAANMRVIALTTTHPREELSEANAVYRGYEEIPLDEWLA